MRNQARALDIRLRDTSHKRSRSKEKQKTYEIKNRKMKKKREIRTEANLYFIVHGYRRTYSYILYKFGIFIFKKVIYY